MKQNEKIGHLTLLNREAKRQKNPRVDGKWSCSCDCGNKKIVTDHYLTTSKNPSCGCLNKKNEFEYNEEIKNIIKKNIDIDENKCWIWMGAKHRQGYGQISYRCKPSLVHRISWIVFKGQIPEAIKVCHKCDVTSCCNPDHLFLGTQKNNVEDAIRKGKFENRKQGKRRNKLQWNQVIEIRRLHGEGIKRKFLMAKYNVKHTCIEKIVNHKSWKTVEV